MYGLKNGVTSVEMECLVSTIIVYMTTTNNEGLIPSLFFYPVISCEGSKIYFFLNAVEKKLSLLKPTFIHIFDYLDFRFKLEKQRNYQCCPITIFCANKLLVPVRDKDLLRKVPIAYSFQCAQAVPLAYSRRNSMQLMPHRDSWESYVRSDGMNEQGWPCSWAVRWCILLYIACKASSCPTRA